MSAPDLGTLPASTLFRSYSGKGVSPAGSPPLIRDCERGRYLADDRLASAVRTAIAVERPLLVTGEPGTGKSALAWSIASELGLGPVLEFHTRSDHLARDVLYSFDHVLRFYEAQTHIARAADPSAYVSLRALGQALSSPRRRVVLIDEIDKASRDFPNDLLNELDRMEFTIAETGQTFRARYRPIVIITSNSERRLPEPFLRRCVFHEIRFPDAATLTQILRERLGPELQDELLSAAAQQLLLVRQLRPLHKPPATAELVLWTQMLHLAGFSAEQLRRTPLCELPFSELLLKTSDDIGTLHSAASARSARVAS